MDNSINSEQFATLYKSRQTIIEILTDLGYDTSAHQSMSMVELHTMMTNDQLNFTVSMLEQLRYPTSIDTVHVHYYEFVTKPRTLKSNNIEQLIDTYYNIQNTLSKNDRLIIIVNDNINDTIVNYLKTQWEDTHILVNIINIARLKFNALKHTMVPPHEILTPEQSDDFKNQYNIKHHKQLPELSRFDPIAQLIGIKPGEICKITRPSKSAITAPYYRGCVNY